jgi:hypothetical protein
MRAWSALTTSMITPPFNCCAMPRFTRTVPTFFSCSIFPPTLAPAGLHGG